MDDKIKEFYSNIKTLKFDCGIKHKEKNFVSNLIVDKKHSLAAELKDDSRDKVYDAAGNTIYSNSPSIVLFYVSIFESFWQQAILYENTQNELEKTKDEMAEIKEYLDFVLGKGTYWKFIVNKLVI
jgi:hypothetical protein